MTYAPFSRVNHVLIQLDKMKFYRAVKVVLYLIFLIALLEIWARGYYAAGRGMSFFASPADQVYMWYPGLRALKDYKYDENDFNLLLLGGSVLTEDWGQIPEFLRKKIKKDLGREANIVNLAAAAHSSLDSYYKYGYLGGKRFDMVAFYQGINEVRANNVPPEVWRNDYSHYSWYDEVNFYFRHPWLRRTGLVLPYFIKHLLVQLEREVTNPGRFAPDHSPKKEWLGYGSDIKTGESFRGNLLKIISAARVKTEPLMVMTFAYYSPEKEEFDEDSPYVRFTEIWGDTGNVIKGIKVHNEVIRELAGDDDFIFLDQERLLGHDRRYFTDICHFSDEGSEVFAENMVGKINRVPSLKKESERK
ncbi:MAG: hypothetical protein U9R44_00830 [Candidatus Omnitrophota bacterium]|nr:hypothetical protein [Candidatus Omnitrophota bacterium]